MADTRREHLPMPWAGQAACRGMDSRLWFPDTPGPDTEASDVAQAKRICHECPVMFECRDYALTANEHYGIWGGMTVREREYERQRRRNGHGMPMFMRRCLNGHDRNLGGVDANGACKQCRRDYQRVATARRNGDSTPA